MTVPQVQVYNLLSSTFGKNVIHVETIYIDEHYSRLLEHVKRYKCKCYCLTPINYDVAKVQFVLDKTKKEYCGILKNRYNELKKYADLQLHVHLAVLPERLNKSEKEDMIKHAYNFFVNELDIVPKEIVFGWFCSDKESEKIAHSMGLKIISPHYHLYERDI